MSRLEQRRENTEAGSSPSLERERARELERERERRKGNRVREIVKEIETD